MRPWAKISFALLLLCQSGLAQGFVNLDFEDSAIVSSQPTGYGWSYGTASVPGWTEYNGWGDANYSGGATLIYNINLWMNRELLWKERIFRYQQFKDNTLFCLMAETF
jgi:hypothetical protein